jgi:hypothetical protein
MIKVRVILEEAKIYRHMDSSNKPLVILQPGKEFNLGKVYKETVERWVEASLPDGRKGYVTGMTKLRVIYPVLTSRGSKLFKSANRSAPTLEEVSAGSRLELLDVTSEGNDAWSLVRLGDGREGYFPPEVEFKREEKKKKRTPGQYAVYGSAAVLIGIILRRFTTTQIGNSLLEMFAWAVIFAGGALIIYSFFLSMRAEAIKKRLQKPRNK